MEKLKLCIITVILLLPIKSICQTKDVFEISVLDLKSSQCENGIDAYRIQKRIISQDIVNDTLHVEISVCTDCGANIVGVAFYSGDTLYLNSGSSFIEEIDQKGDTLKYLEKGADCFCDYVFLYKLESKRTFNFIKYDGELIKYHENHFRPKVKIQNNDTLFLFDDCYLDCYFKRTKDYFKKYCYFPSGELETVQYYFNDTDSVSLEVFDKNGSTSAIIWKKTSEYPEYILEYLKNNSSRLDTINSFEESKKSKYYKYLNTF